MGVRDSSSQNSPISLPFELQRIELLPVLRFIKMR